MKKAYFVVGPESSGNRHMTRIIASSGIIGKDTSKQPVDGPEFSLALPGEDFVCTRSIPHGEFWLDIPAQIQQAAKAGYKTFVIARIRNPFACAKSQVKRKLTTSFESGLIRIEATYKLIFSCLAVALNGLIIPYGSERTPNFINDLKNWLQLDKIQDSIQWIDGDSKYGY